MCHSRIHLDQLIQDAAGRELLVEMAKLPTQLASSLLSYIGLFRPLKSDLNNGRALTLVQSTLALTKSKAALAQALTLTVHQISERRQQQTTAKNDQQPLKNHNYLEKVLASCAQQAPIADKQGNTASLEIKRSATESVEENRRKWQQQMDNIGKRVC